MRTAVLIGPEPVYVDFSPEQPLNGFRSCPSAAAFAQGLLTREEALAAEWLPASQPIPPKPTWRH
ncbi:hypothetical protein D3C71_1060360 [compost metagenome]